MHLIDWLVVLLPLVAVLWIGAVTRRYVKSVADFLAGSRLAGRYLLAVSAGEASMGLITVIAIFEMSYKSGFALGFWGGIGTILGMILTLTGFAIYRYRETRVMTMAQFLEVRYSKAFRIFAGILAFVSGVLNYAIFPAVSARFLVSYCGLPEHLQILSLDIPTTALVMIACLSVALTLVLWGGHLTIMVVDCVQGIFAYVGYTVLVIAVLCFFSFSQFHDAMMSRPPGQSFINPFDVGKLNDFNVFYVIIGLIGMVYSRLSWMGGQSFQCSAESPHEQKMAGVLGAWRSGFQGLMISLLLVGAFTLLNHPDFSGQAQAVHQELAATINMGDAATTDTVRNQMLVPVALKHFLPIGVIGTFAAVMIFMMIAVDTAYLHSWGSVLIQDIILPLRKRPFTPQQQLRAIRWSILGIAIFAFIYSLTFPQFTYIYMYFAITGAIYLGGAGAVMLGGLYWKWGTTAGAWAAMLSGTLMGVVGFAILRTWPGTLYPWLSSNAPEFLAAFKRDLEGLGDALPFVHWEVTAKAFPISAAEVGFLTTIVAVSMYIGVSLLTRRESFDLDRMLHRTPGNTEHKAVEGEANPGWIQKLVGITDEFTRGDKILAWSVFGWAMFTFGIWVVQAVWNIVFGYWESETWFLWWKYWTVPSSLLVGAVTTVWFIIGGTRDMKKLFSRLKTLKHNAHDDGRVIGHRNADEVETDHEPKPEAKP